MSSCKKIVSFFLVFFLSIFQTSFAAAPPTQPVYDTNMLPTDYQVYTNKNGVVINHPNPNFWKVYLPTTNNYTGVPGCYVACYSKSAAGLPSAGYQVGNFGIYVHGQVRVPGNYVKRECVPTGYAAGTDLSKVGPFNALCNQYIAFCAGASACGAANSSCWAGGDTGGWYGIQP